MGCSHKQHGSGGKRILLLIQVNGNSPITPILHLVRNVMEHGRYWVALFKEGGESAGVEHELSRDWQLNEARSKYKQSIATYPNRLVMLCDRSTVLARSDRNGPYTFLRRAG
jgi:hypothetical protein